MTGSEPLAAIMEHAGRVFTLAVYMLGDHGEAEDVTQEVLIRAWQSAHEVAPDRLGAWLLRVARNRCIDHLRTRRSRWAGLREAAGAAVASARDSAPDPEALAWGSDLRAALGRALAELAEPFRSVVILREIQGLSYREISDALELPLATVRVTLHRGRRRLRDALREEYRHVAAS